MRNSRVKLIFVLSTVLLLFFTSFSVYMSYMRITRTVEESVANQSLEAAKSIAASMDIEVYKKFLSEPIKNESYWDIRSYLNDAREKLGVLYVYTLKVDNPRVSQAMIMGYPKVTNDKNDYPIGIDCTVPEEQVKRAYEGKTYVTGVLIDPVYGDYLSVGAPVKDSEGNIIAYLGIDFSLETLNEIKKKVLEDNMFLLLFNGVFILIVLGSFLFMQKWYKRETAKEVEVTEDTYLTEIQTLITSVSSLRHDVNNHILVLHGLLQLGESEKALQYVSTLSKEVKRIESFQFDIGHPGLSILLQTKKLAAENQRIDMHMTLSQDSFEHIKTTDLIIILSNLIDNAMDATMELPEKERKISIECAVNDGQYLFKVTNTGPKIKDSTNVFKQGYSTKKGQQGKVRGQGLFIVKEVVSKYNGSISINSSTDFITTAIVEIPIK